MMRPREHDRRHSAYDSGGSVARPGRKSPHSSVPGKDSVDHPAHYGGTGNPYEAILVIEAWRLGFCLGNALKYICRAGKKSGADTAQDLRKAIWYLTREAERFERKGRK